MMVCEQNPDNAGLNANLGMSHLIAGDVDAALTVTREALAMDPSDEITRSLLEWITDAAEGRRKRPTKYP
jgi:Flp pilus assembly protein TadD